MATFNELKLGQSHLLKAWTLDSSLRNRPKWIAFSENDSDFWIAEMIEKFESQSGTGTLKEGQVALTQFSQSSQVLQQKLIPYSDSLIKLSRTLPLNQHFLSSSVYFAKQIVYSLGSFGGTAVLNLNSAEWTTQATLGSAYVCQNPQVIQEGSGN